MIDTGIRFGHADFGGRAISGFDVIDGGSADDCNGHGTHVSSTLGGGTYGVAKGVTLIGVRVLNCNGSGATSGVIAGIDWVVGNHQAGQPAVANLSLGGGASTAVDPAIGRLIGDGVTVAVAAGNSSANACNTLPGPGARRHHRGRQHQRRRAGVVLQPGPVRDIIAPGRSITAAWSTSNTATNTISGTSMASPHSAGAAAKYLQTQPGASPDAVANALRSSAARDASRAPPDRAGSSSARRPRPTCCCRPTSDREREAPLRTWGRGGGEAGLGSRKRRRGGEVGVGV